VREEGEEALQDMTVRKQEVDSAEEEVEVLGTA
jgi:hypothetical protein